jgi:hypothetical protein
MASTKREITEFLKCGHCGNRAPMDIVAEYYLSTKPTYNDPFDDYPYDYYHLEPERGYHYKLLLCLSCKQVTLWKYFDADYIEEDIRIETLYPPEALKLSGLPHQIQRAYEIALKVRVIDANAYAVLIGRILEMICDDRQAIGKNLYHKLSDLAAKGEIPDKLVGVADSLRQLRNFGAHASLGELTPDELPILDDLCRAILEYVYNAPYLVERAELSLDRLKEKTSKQLDKSD